MNQSISEVNRQLKDRYPGPHGPEYWLLDVDGVVVVRGWRLEINGTPMGDHLAVCRTVEEALRWIDCRPIRSGNLARFIQEVTGPSPRPCMGNPCRGNPTGSRRPHR